MKKILFLCFSLVFAKVMFAQQSVSISGPSNVEVGVPYNYTFAFTPVYPWNQSNTVQADDYVITDWIVQTGTNGQSVSVPGYINTPSNQSSYYYDGTYDNSNPKIVAIQWGDGTFLSIDNITVKVSGFYKKNSTGEVIGYFNFVEKAQSVTVQRIVAPIIEGPSPILSCNQTNQTYTFSNATNSNQRLWTVSGATIIGSATGTSVTVKPNLTGNFNISCTVKRSGANSNYSKTGSKTVTRIPPTTTAIISGNLRLCSGSTSYTVTNLPVGHTFSSWSISSSSIATLSSTTNATTSLTKVGQGTVTLTANILNSCNETIPITKIIYVGSPILPATAFVDGATYTGYNQTLNYTLSGSSINGGTSYQWSVDGPMNDDGGPTCAWQILGGQGTQTVTLKSGCISAIVVVKVVATSSCGSSNTKYIYVTVGSDPCPPALKLSQNPIKDRNLVANVIYPPDCDPLARNTNTINNEVKIYDLNGNIVYKSKQNSDELIINNLQIKKGIYLLQVITENGEIIKDKIIVE